MVPFSRDIAKRMAQSVTDVKDWVVLPGIGHWTQQEAATEVNEALLGFLKGL